MSTTYPPLTQPTKNESKALKITLFILIWMFKLFFAFLLFILSIAGGLATGAYFRLADLPDAGKLKYYSPNERSEIVTKNGVVLKQIFGEENRKVIPLAEIPVHTLQAVQAIEDARFKTHKGVDPIGLLRAIKTNMDSNETVQGGSTITQQLVKNLYFTNERTYARKAAEAILSIQVEQEYTKEQILEIYLNMIYWGHNAYGIETAAETYFGKSAKELKLHESAMLAGLIRSPEINSPYRDYKKAKHLQSVVLNKMVEHKFLDRATADKAKKEPLKLHGIRRGMLYPYFTTYAMAELKKHFSEAEIEEGGLRVVTTLDIKKQDLMSKALWNQLQRLKGANVEQGAMVMINAKTGHVEAIVGGTDFGKNQFNRAFQAQRQTGSSFKPFVYVTGFENGFRPESVLVDGPTTFNTGGGSTYTPVNYGRNHSGAMTISSALRASTNIIAVKVMDQVGVEKVVEMTKRLGIKSEVRPFLSSALGASEITPLEMAQAYSTFASDGILREASPFVKIEDKFGKVVLDHEKRPGKRVLDIDVVRALNHTLVSVVTSGTGSPAYIPGYSIAAKTGTTSSHKDVWFVGYTPKYVTAVWLGNDTPTRMYGATGGHFCAPAWKEYMQGVLKSEKDEPFPPRVPLNRPNKLKKPTFKTAKVKEGDEKEDRPTAAAAEVRSQNQSAANAPALRVRHRVHVPVPEVPTVDRGGRMEGGGEAAPPPVMERGGRMGE